MLAIAVLLGAAVPARAGLGPCKADAQRTPLCGSGKGAARVVEKTISPDGKFALAWRHPDKDPDSVDDSDSDLELLLIHMADGAVLAKADTEYFRNPGQYANRRAESALWSTDSHMVVRLYDLRYVTDAVTLYRIGADGTLAGQIELDPMIEQAVHARLNKIRRNPEDYGVTINFFRSRLGNDGTLTCEAIAFIVKKDPEVDYRVTIKVTGATGPLRARIVSLRQTHAQ